MDVVMLAGRYTLLERTALDVLLGECADRGGLGHTAGVYNSGLLARARADAGSMYNYVRASPGWWRARTASLRSAGATASPCRRW